MDERTSFDFDGFIMNAQANRVARPSDEGYPFDLPAVRTLETLLFHENVTFLVGENGSGKSTLIEALAIAAGFNAEGGSKAFNFKTADANSNLHEFIRLTRAAKREKGGYFLRAESFFNVATRIDQIGVSQGYGKQSLHQMSHGESFLALFEHRFKKNSLYFFDEPEAALSPQRLLSLISYIHELCEHDCQFIIATHSPILLAYPDAWIYEITDHGVNRAQWDELEHVDLTRQFLANPKTFLDILCEVKND